MVSHDDYWKQRLAYTPEQLYRIVVGRNLLDGYALDKAGFDKDVDALPAAAVVLGDQPSATYSDADRYRIVTEHQIQAGNVADSAEFNAMVRGLGEIEAFDQFIAFRAQRPGCIADEGIDNFSCACGRKWSKADPAPPACNFQQLQDPA